MTYSSMNNDMCESPKIYIGISPMGTGKTTMLQGLNTGDFGILGATIRLQITERQSILNVSSHSDISHFMAKKLQLKEPNKDHIPNNSLWSHDRLSIHFNLLRFLGKREKGYDVVVMDDYDTTI